MIITFRWGERHIIHIPHSHSFLSSLAGKLGKDGKTGTTSKASPADFFYAWMGKRSCPHAGAAQRGMELLATRSPNGVPFSPN
jgi:hypothetical protein